MTENGGGNVIPYDGLMSGGVVRLPNACENRITHIQSSMFKVGATGPGCSSHAQTIVAALMKSVASTTCRAGQFLRIHRTSITKAKRLRAVETCRPCSKAKDWQLSFARKCRAVACQKSLRQELLWIWIDRLVARHGPYAWPDLGALGYQHPVVDVIVESRARLSFPRTL